MIASTPLLDDAAYDELRLRLALDFQKWDSQIGDVEALGRYAIVLTRDAWRDLATTAEALARELAEVEAEIAQRPDLWSLVGLPRPLRAAFERERPSLRGPRVLRFDFHPTHRGWALSEVNADVPGGFVEASAVPMLVAPHFAGTNRLPDPTEILIDAMLEASAGAPIGLLVAPGHMEDMQVVTHLRARIRARGGRAAVGHAHAFSRHRGRIHVNDEEVGLVYRFYQAEWLAGLDSFEALKWLFSRGPVPIVNPGVAAITESKRLPLAFPDLEARTITLRSLFPETRAPSAVDWLREPEEWVLKGAYSNTGDAVIFPERLSRSARVGLAARVLARPAAWVAQRRFRPVPISTPRGSAHAAIGVYAIDGKVAGAYVRIATSHIVDARALDVACLVAE